MNKVLAVNLADLEWEAVSRGRKNAIRRKRLPMFCEVTGATFEYSYSIAPKGYFTPKHKHNFDQIRYTVSGNQSTGLGDLGPDECGYFPEGAFYGPQNQEEDCAALVLQFQGASGEHLLSNEEMNATYQKMISNGAKFENGIYSEHKPNGRKVSKDSYVAIWEQHEGEKLKFPKPRYRQPVMMLANEFRWLKSFSNPGVFTKHLMSFTEYKNEIGFIKIQPKAFLNPTVQTEVELRYLLNGEVNFEGKTWGPDSYFFMPRGCDIDKFQALSEATFFSIKLPMISYLADQIQ